MKHLTEEQIVMHYYGEAPDSQELAEHLASCAECRAEFEKLKALLAQIPATPTPEPPEYLEQKVWFYIRDRMDERRARDWKWFFSPARFATAGAVAVLVIAAFLAGRYLVPPHRTDISKNPPIARDTGAGLNPQRVVLVAVGDHLERSQMLLIEIMNTDAKDRVGLSHEQEQARNLLDNNRLYRLSAQTTDPTVAPVLDELERVLTEIADSPAQPSANDLRVIRSSIQSQDLLFKIRVIHSNVTEESNASSKQVNQRL